MARKAGEPLSARCRLGQHANPSESNAMPKHRPSSVPAPETSAPSSNVTTIAGSIIRTRPVPTSTTAAKARIFLRGVPASAVTHELPAAVGVVILHGLDDLVGLFAEVPFVHSTVPADEEGHDPRRTVRDGIGDERNAARHAAVPQVALRPTRRGQALRGEDAEVVA